MFRQAQHDRFGGIHTLSYDTIFLVIQSAIENLAEAKRHYISGRKTSFRSHEIATPNQSARNDKYGDDNHYSVLSPP